jgi:drug/metabolite transporter (DMT)-like permease
MKLAAALGLLYVIWGSTYLGIDVAERTLPPLLMLSVRFLLAGAILYAWAAKRGDVARERPGRREWLAAAGIGALLLVGSTGGLALAEKHVQTGTAALFIASIPLFMAVLDRAVFRTRIPPVAGIGILTGLAGVAILAGPSGAVPAGGAAMLLVAAFAWAAGSVFARIATQSGSIVLTTAMQMLMGGLLLAVAGAALGELGQVHPSAVSPASLGALAYLIVVGALVAYTAYGWLLRNASTPVLTSYAYVNPAVAVMLGWGFAGEHLGAREIVAGLVVLSSVVLILVAPKSAPATVTELPRRMSPTAADQAAA